jgi:hypothetical protein
MLPGITLPLTASFPKVFAVFGIAASLTLDNPRFESQQWKKTFCTPKKFETHSEAHPSSYSIITGDKSPELKRPELEAYHLSPSSSGVRIFASFSRICLYGIYMETILPLGLVQ